MLSRLRPRRVRHGRDDRRRRRAHAGTPLKRVLLVLLLAVAAAVAVTYFVPADGYLILPDEAKPLASRVTADGERPDRDGGGIYYVDVVVRKASLLENHVAQLRPEGADLVPAHALVPEGSSFEERRRQNRRAMDRSELIAAAVALRELGEDVKADPDGARVVAVAPDAPAHGRLRSGDVIVSVDGSRVRTPEELRRTIGRRDPGDTVRLRVRADGKVRTEEVRTIASPDDEERPIVGIQVEQNADIELPVDVDIDLGNVGGPSAGLAFALDLLEELGRDTDRGYKVAATGELQLDGTVSPIGGAKQKAIGAQRAGAEIFVVPAGDNATDVRRHAGKMRILAVENFQQALEQLDALPKKAD